MTPYRRVLLLVTSIWLLLGTNWAGASPSPQQDSRFQYGETVRGQLNDIDSEKNWLFTGQAGDRILIDMQASESNGLDTYLTLLDPHGNTLFVDDDSGDALNSRIGPLELSETGDYTVIAARYSGSGEYVLQVVNLNTVPTIKAGKSLVGVMDSTHPTDYFLLAAGENAPDTLFRLQVSDDDLYSDPNLSLYGPNGFVMSTEYQEEGLIDPLVSTAGASYVIVVSWNSSSAGGPYELLLTESSISLLQNGIAQSGTLDFETNFQRHYFRGQAGQRVRVTVLTTDGNVAPALQITTLDYDQFLFSNDGAGVRELTLLLELSNDTVYMIEVGDGAYTGETGTYDLVVEWIN